MKYNKIIYIAMATVLIGTIGCNKEKFSINANPDDVTDASVTPSVLLPAAQQATATTIAADQWWMAWWMGHGARSGSYQSLNEEETYNFTQGFHNELWNNLYANANNYNVMTNKAQQIGAGTYEAIGRIMRSLNFHMLVDIYNNIPYTEALQGTLKPLPKYDKGIDVYKGIFADLDAALLLLNDPDATDPAKNADIATADFVFQGNLLLWKKFANTLRLRLLIHLHNGINTPSVVPGINIATEMAKTTADGFLGVGQNATMQPGFSGTKPTPYYRFYHTNEAGTSSQRDHLRASDYAIRYYNVDGDPRRQRFYVHPASGAQGIVFGTPAGAGVPIGSDLSTIRGIGYIPNGAASRAWILTSSESLFLQAEARQRGFLTSGPSAQTLLRDAIRESFVFLGLTNADADAYIAYNAGFPDVDITAGPLAPGLPTGGIYTIVQSKWFALNMINNLEIWTDYRRTDIVYGIGGGFDAGPTLSVDPGRTATSIPRRLFYPQSEYSYNAANVAAEGTINVFTGKIFWDLN